MRNREGAVAPPFLRLGDDTYLRHFVPNDAPHLVEAVRSHADFIGSRQEWPHHVHEDTERSVIEHCARLTQEGQMASYALFYQHRLVGSVALHSFASNYARLGYWRIDTPQVRGIGLVTQASREVVNMGLACLGLAAVCAEIHPDNTPSRKVVERLGAWFMGVTGEGMLIYAMTEPSQDEEKVSY